MNIAEHFPALVIVIPLLFALITWLAGLINRAFCWVIVLTITFLCFLMSFSILNTVMHTGRISYHMGAWEPPWGIEYAIDYLNGFVLVVVSFIAFIVTLYSRKSVGLEIDEEKSPAFYSLYMLLFTGLMGMTITGDIFNLYVFIEITSLSGYALIAIGRRRNSLMASFNYLPRHNRCNFYINRHWVSLHGDRQPQYGRFERKTPSALSFEGCSYGLWILYSGIKPEARTVKNPKAVR